MISWFRPRWRWWHLALLMTAMVLELFARPELAMTSQPSVDPLAEVVLDTGLGWRIILFVALPLYLFNVAREAGGQVEDQVLLRLGGYPQLALHGFATSVAGAVPIITCLVTPSVAIGLGAASLARPSWTLGTSGQLAVAEFIHVLHGQALPTSRPASAISARVRAASSGSSRVRA